MAQGANQSGSVGACRRLSLHQCGRPKRRRYTHWRRARPFTRAAPNGWRNSGRLPRIRKLGRFPGRLLCRRTPLPQLSGSGGAQRLAAHRRLHRRESHHQRLGDGNHDAAPRGRALGSGAGPHPAHGRARQAGVWQRAPDRSRRRVGLAGAHRAREPPGAVATQAANHRVRAGALRQRGADGRAARQRRRLGAVGTGCGSGGRTHQHGGANGYRRTPGGIPRGAGKARHPRAAGAHRRAHRQREPGPFGASRHSLGWCRSRNGRRRKRAAIRWRRRNDKRHRGRQQGRRLDRKPARGVPGSDPRAGGARRSGLPSGSGTVCLGVGRTRRDHRPAAGGDHGQAAGDHRIGCGDTVSGGIEFGRDLHLLQGGGDAVGGRPPRHAERAHHHGLGRQARHRRHPLQRRAKHQHHQDHHAGLHRQRRDGGARRHHPQGPQRLGHQDTVFRRPAVLGPPLSPLHRTG